MRFPNAAISYIVLKHEGNMPFENDGLRTISTAENRHNAPSVAAIIHHRRNQNTNKNDRHHLPQKTAAGGVGDRVVVGVCVSGEQGGAAVFRRGRSGFVAVFGGVRILFFTVRRRSISVAESTRPAITFPARHTRNHPLPTPLRVRFGSRCSRRRVHDHRRQSGLRQFVGAGFFARKTRRRGVVRHRHLPRRRRLNHARQKRRRRTRGLLNVAGRGAVQSPFISSSKSHFSRGIRRSP